MNMLRHKGYLATIELDSDAGLFHGDVINARPVLTFQGRSIDELKSAFADTIADYEEWCRERGKEPDRPSGLAALTFQVPPELFQRLVEAAEQQGKTLDGFIEEKLERAMQRTPEQPEGARTLQ